MRVIGLTAAEAEQALLEVSTHIPAAVTLGRPTVALRRADTDEIEFATNSAFLYLHGEGAERLCPNEDGSADWSQWRDGRLVGLGCLSD